jgi:actin related protein 2/3 complex subunit 4
MSVQLKRVRDLETWLRSKRIAFMMQRADNIDIIRRKPVPGFDISFLVTARHLQVFDKAALIDFIITLMTELASVNDLKRLISSRGRISSVSITKALTT